MRRDEYERLQEEERMLEDERFMLSKESSRIAEKLRGVRRRLQQVKDGQEVLLEAESR